MFPCSCSYTQLQHLFLYLSLPFEGAPGSTNTPEPAAAPCSLNYPPTIQYQTLQLYLLLPLQTFWCQSDKIAPAWRWPCTCFLLSCRRWSSPSSPFPLVQVILMSERPPLLLLTPNCCSNFPSPPQALWEAFPHWRPCLSTPLLYSHVSTITLLNALHGSGLKGLAFQLLSSGVLDPNETSHESHTCSMAPPCRGKSALQVVLVIVMIVKDQK